VRPLALVAILAAALCGARAGADEACGPLFVIERSVNANVVLYEAGLRSDGTLDPANPVRVTWRLDEQDGRREDLTPIERAHAYGVDVSPLGEPDAWRIRVRALPTRLLVLRASGSCPLVTTEVAGRNAVLRRVFVTSTVGFIPKVSSVDFSGLDLETLLPVTERFVPSR
jgi:hypothetical protein